MGRSILCSVSVCMKAAEHVYVCMGEQCYGIWLTLADYGYFVLAEQQHFWRLTCDSPR